MKIRELIEEDIFSGIRNEVFTFADKIQEKYNNELNDFMTQKEGKEIFDVVWGPVEFNAAETIILDSPLLQRLRKIKQLGLASYVYCSADYSRFSHTVGVFYIANRMAHIISKGVDGNSEYDFAQIARLAALFHDTGHMYFSHVSEYYFAENIEFSRHEEVKNALARFGEVLGKKVAFHEMVSVLIVHAPSTEELMKEVAPSLEGIKIRNDKELKKIIEYISCMIVGVANDAYILPYSQIISGSVDADKCDYLSRDSHATNVPVAVDIFRLIHKLSVEKEPQSRQSSELWSDAGITKIFYNPTIKSSAIEALNQLLMARTIMFNSVYYHQKVRTAEVTMRNILAKLHKLGIPQVTNFTSILQTTDDTFGSQCYKIMADSVEEDKKKELQQVIDELGDLNNRIIMKRACAISNENIVAHKYKFYEFDKDILKLGKPEKIQKIESLTKVEYEKIAKLLNIKVVEEVKFSIVEFPRCVPEYSKADTLISYGNGQVKRASEAFQTATWIGSKEGRNREHYLVTNCKYRELAFLAVQKVLYDLYKVKLLDHAAVYSKTKLEDLVEQKRKLFEKDYYKEALILVADSIFQSYRADFIEIREKYQTYEGEKGRKVSLDAITKYLGQFLQISMPHAECILLIDGLIRILKRGIFINRELFVDGMRRLLKNIPAPPNGLKVYPLGGERDSAKHLMYYMNDLNKDFLTLKICSSIQELIKESEKSANIIFFDDGAYSGRQVVSIFKEYMGISIRETNEIHVQELTEIEKQELKKKKIIIMYICFNEENEKTIKSELGQIGLLNIEIHFCYSMKNKILNIGNDIFKSDKQVKCVKKYIEMVSKDILRTAKSIGDKLKDNWTEERITASALGYNDAQQMVILNSSVPTYTITPFWLSGGSFCDMEWTPLFSRTTKVD